MKSASLGIGDKVVALNTLGKEWRKESQEQHKALLEALSGIEMALTKQRTVSSAAEMGTIPVVQAYEQSSGAIPAMSPPMAPLPVVPAAMPPQPIYGAPTTFWCSYR